MYTRFPRTILWLIPGGPHECLAVEGLEAGAMIEIEPFYVGKFPVTNEQFEAFDPAFARSASAAGDSDPALGVSFEDAVEYCRWYAEVSRKPMRLPSEVEWEYACCGGAEGIRLPSPEEIDAISWHAGNSSNQLPKLDRRQANGFGLFGMLGGVWEWVTPSASVNVTDPIARGGSWLETRASIHCGRRRVGAVPVADAGFRVAKSLR